MTGCLRCLLCISISPVSHSVICCCLYKLQLILQIFAFYICVYMCGYVVIDVCVYRDTHTNIVFFSLLKTLKKKISWPIPVERLYSEGRMSAWYLSSIWMVAVQNEESCARRLPSTSNCSVFFLWWWGGAAGLYTCQIYLAANFESHPLLKSPLLLLCINDFSAVQYWSAAFFMLTWVRWVMEGVIRVLWVSCSPFPEFQQFLLGFIVNPMMCCMKSQYPPETYSSMENPPKMRSPFSEKVFQ